MKNEALESKEYQALNLLEKGQKLMNPSGIKGLFKSKNSSYDEAFTCFKQAGDLYKQTMNFSKAAYCYEQCAASKDKMKENEMDSLKEALYCYNKANDKENYMRVLDKSMLIFTKKGNFSEAAKMCWQSAEKAEKEDNAKEAIMLYEKAVDYFGMDTGNQTTKIHMCLLKKAELMCQSNDTKAGEECKSIFEKVAIDYMKSALTKSASLELFIKAVICSIAYEANVNDAKERIAKYKQLNSSIEDSGHDILIRDTIAGVETSDVVKVKTAFKKFKAINGINNWYVQMYTTIIDKVENSLNKQNGFGEDEVIDDFK